MTLDPQGVLSMLRTAELTNAPASGFAQLVAERLTALDEALTRSGPVTVGYVGGLLAIMLAEIAACELLVLNSTLQDESRGSVQAEIVAGINEALGATARAFGVLTGVYERIEWGSQEADA